MILARAKVHGTVTESLTAHAEPQCLSASPPEGLMKFVTQSLVSSVTLLQLFAASFHSLYVDPTSLSFSSWWPPSVAGPCMPQTCWSPGAGWPYPVESSGGGSWCPQGALGGRCSHRRLGCWPCSVGAVLDPRPCAPHPVAPGATSVA